jgi:hypothetical protein
MELIVSNLLGAILNLQGCKDNKLILYPKDKYLLFEELIITETTNSKIIKCIVITKNNQQISNKQKYRSILQDIWKNMSSQKIIQNTSFNIKLTKENTKGYTWNDELGFSFQSKDAKGTLKEIIHMCNLNNYSIEIKIELENKKIINYKN